MPTKQTPWPCLHELEQTFENIEPFGSFMPTLTTNTTKEDTIEADFCVVGGGMAGVCAALAAARNGIQTVLVQDRPVLGGNASSEIRMWICGAHGAENKETGILEELLLKNLYYNPMLLYPAWDHVLHGACMEQQNLTTLLNCSVHDLSMEGNAISAVHAWHLTRHSRMNIHAKLFADCSGDSILRMSGAEYRWGREGRDEFEESHAPAQPDRKTMGNSILIQLRETDRHVPFIPPPWAHHYTDESAPNRDLNPKANNFWWMEIGGVQDTIDDADTIRDELLRIAYGVWAYIKNHPDGRGRNWELDWIGSLPGKRENVRYVGDHILTQNDIEAEGRFDDLVAYGGWSMDDHHPDAIRHPGAPTIFHPAPPVFGIPYRSLYSRTITNLFFAGRNISATHMGMSATRVMAPCAVMGQAIGTAAAIAVDNQLTPRGVYEHKIRDLRKLLVEQDSYLPWQTRTIPPLSRHAELTASNGDPTVLLDGIERNISDQDHGWWAKKGEWAAYLWNTPTVVENIRLVLDSDLSRNKRMLCCYPKDRQPESMPNMLARDFDIDIRTTGGDWKTIFKGRDNIQRLVTLAPPPEPLVGCRLHVHRSWDDDRSHVFAFDVDSKKTDFPGFL
ncbi:MAG: FAD-dependent oxidoreductase [Kiritimatiellales bacterium]|nr:FAD-dependent oxidoreductase [Kiritimatiellales bacterium]